MAQWDRIEASVSRFKLLESVSQLPARPTPEEMTYGYIINNELYVYVETDGNILNGLYENCGAFKGDPGKSAYQIAVDNGYVGSESQWLASLHGEDGKDAEVVNSLTEGGTDKALSAEMGKYLHENCLLLGDVVENISD